MRKKCRKSLDKASTATLTAAGVTSARTRTRYEIDGFRTVASIEILRLSWSPQGRRVIFVIATRPNSRKSSRDEKMAPSINQRHVRGGTSLVLSSARSLICEQPPRCSIAPFLRSNHVGSHGNGVTTRSVLQLASSCGSSAEDGVQRGGRELIYSVFWIDFDRPIDP